MNLISFLGIPLSYMSYISNPLQAANTLKAPQDKIKVKWITPTFNQYKGIDAVSWLLFSVFLYLIFRSCLLTNYFPLIHTGLFRSSTSSWESFGNVRILRNCAISSKPLH